MELGAGVEAERESSYLTGCVGVVSVWHMWFPELCKYTTKVNEFDTCNMSKVKFIKLFKNGRVDIKFRSAAYVQEFVEQCMRRRSV